MAKGWIGAAVNPLILRETGDPQHLQDTGIVHSVDVGGRTELHYEDDTGARIQITSAGALNIVGGGGVTGSGTANQVAYWTSASAISGITVADGQLVVGRTGLAPVAASLTGTANQVTVTNGVGSITLSTPQDIAAASSPTFVRMTLTEAVLSPLVVTSTAVVTNLNADILDGQHGAFYQNASNINAGILGVGFGGTGTATAFTTGSVVFAGASGVYTQDNAGLFFDPATNRLGVNTAAPATTLHVVGDATISGKLTVGGAIDPTFIRLTSGGTADVYVEWTNGLTVPVSNAGEGRIRYNATAQKFQFSENAGAYTDLVTAAGGMSIGGAVTGATTGSVLFIAAGPVLAQNNARLVWDDSTGRFGINGNIAALDDVLPAAELTVIGGVGSGSAGIRIFGTSGGSGSYATLFFAEANQRSQLRLQENGGHGWGDGVTGLTALILEAGSPASGGSFPNLVIGTNPATEIRFVTTAVQRASFGAAGGLTFVNTTANQLTLADGDASTLGVRFGGRHVGFYLNASLEMTIRDVTSAVDIVRYNAIHVGNMVSGNVTNAQLTADTKGRWVVRPTADTETGLLAFIPANAIVAGATQHAAIQGLFRSSAGSADLTAIAGVAQVGDANTDNYSFKALAFAQTADAIGGADIWAYRALYDVRTTGTNVATYRGVHVLPAGTATGNLDLWVGVDVENAPAGTVSAFSLRTGTNKALFGGEVEIDGALNHDGTTVGFFGTAPAVQQVSAANLTNNVTAGGTDNVIADFTDLTTYANDAATIRNDIYQLARKLKQVNDGLRVYGLLT